MKATVAITIDTHSLASKTDEYLAALWHVAQANPADISDRTAGRLAECIGREIIRRFLAATPPILHFHQGHHADWCELSELKGAISPSTADSQEAPPA